MGSIGINSAFSEHSHFAYQLKENQGSKYFAHIPFTPPDPGDGVNRSKFFFFPEHGHVAYQIKENHKCSNMVANILHADPRPWGWVQ